MALNFGFDLDDTLTYNDVNFNEIQDEAFHNFSRILNDVSFSKEDVLKGVYERQKKLIPNAGFSRELFPQAMRYVYSKIARDNGRNEIESKRLGDLAYSLGCEVLDENRWKSKGIYAGVPDTLNFLKEKGVDLKLITLGDDKMQRRKVEVLGLDEWFSPKNIYVELFGKQKILKKLYDKGSLDCFIGNSYGSDIEAALSVHKYYSDNETDSSEGPLPIWIPQNTWDKNPEKMDPRVMRLDNISQVKDIYNSHLRRQN